MTFSENPRRPAGNGEYFTLNNSIITTNSIRDLYSPLSISGGDIIIVNNSIFTNNTGAIGGALSYSTKRFNTSNLTIENSKFLNNTATDKGGALSYLSMKTIMKNVTITNNVANNANSKAYNDIFTYEKQMYLLVKKKVLEEQLDLHSKKCSPIDRSHIDSLSLVTLSPNNKLTFLNPFQFNSSSLRDINDNGNMFYAFKPGEYTFCEFASGSALSVDSGHSLVIADERNNLFYFEKAHTGLAMTTSHA